MLANAVISNPAGLEGKVYFNGLPVELALPVSVVAHHQVLNVTISNYDDELHVTFIALKEAIPDVQRLADGTMRALVELQRSVAKGSTATAENAADPGQVTGCQASAKPRYSHETRKAVRCGARIALIWASSQAARQPIELRIDCPRPRRRGQAGCALAGAQDSLTRGRSQCARHSRLARRTRRLGPVVAGRPAGGTPLGRTARHPPAVVGVGTGTCRRRLDHLVRGRPGALVPRARHLGAAVLPTLGPRRTLRHRAARHARYPYVPCDDRRPAVPGELLPRRMVHAARRVGPWRRRIPQGVRRPCRSCCSNGGTASTLPRH